MALAPVWAVVLGAVGLDMLRCPHDRGRVFYRERRVSQGRSFDLLKLRTLRESVLAEAEGHVRPFEADVENLTWAGRRVLKPLYLDELPQLVNVLRGDMSLVGPRPCIPYEVKSFQPQHFERFLLPAGLTGLWQVTARAYSSFGEALDMDVAYVRGWSFGLDLRLICRTPLQVLRHEGTA